MNKHHKTDRKKTTKKDTGGGTNNIVRVFGENVTGVRPATFSQNMAYARSGVQVFRCSGVQVLKVNDILEG